MVKVVNTRDMTRVIILREQSRPVKHVSFDVSGSFLAVSCSDGQIYVYSLTSEEPALVKKVDGLIKAVETDAEASSKVLWHPDGRAFAAATPTRGKSGYIIGERAVLTLVKTSRLSHVVIGSAREHSSLATLGISPRQLGLQTVAFLQRLATIVSLSFGTRKPSA